MSYARTSLNLKMAPLREYVGAEESRWQGSNTGAAGGNNAFPVANDALIIPLTTPYERTLIDLVTSITVVSGSRTFDLGLYDDAFGAISRLGSTAAVVGTQTLSPNYTLIPSKRYYVVVSASTSTAAQLSFFGVSNGFSATQCRLRGFARMASGHPLPSTLTPTQWTTGSGIPIIAARFDR